MTKRMKVFAIVVFMLVIGTGTASAYENNKNISVIINLDGVPRMVSTEKETVGELLDTIDELVNTEYDLESLTEQTELTDNMVIDLSSFCEKTVTTTKQIDFKTAVKETSALKEGEDRVTQEGSNGVRTITYQKEYQGGNEISSTLVEDKVTKEPVNKIIEKGVKNAISGYQYAYAINVSATGYTPYDAGCNGITATGTKATKGVIAVDPRVIPLGTKVFIPGYGEAIAADTGGAIKGNKIDLCYTSKSEAFAWGRRPATVYVLK